MSPAEARSVLADLWSAYWAGSVPSADFARFAATHHVAEGTAPTVEEERETVEELERLVAEGEAPAGVVEAFHVAAEDNRRRYEDAQAVFRRESAEHGLHAVGSDAQESFADPAVFDAFMDLQEALKRETGRKITPGSTRVLFLNPRNRESRPRTARSRRSRSSPSGSSSDDDGLADSIRRCPRCGGAVRALLPSPHWRCDPCADALWETMVERELGRVLAEADRITRGAS